MTKFDKFKLDVAKCESSIELQGLIDGLYAAAIIYCNSEEELKCEVYRSANGESNISMNGLDAYLNSEC